MIEAITEDGYLRWQCIIRDSLDDEIISCGEMQTAHIDSVVYREMEGATIPGRGAMIDLPRCQCGAQLQLKADYTLKELWHETLPIDEQGNRWNGQGTLVGYALPLRYVRNLRIHWMLYSLGRAAHAPVLAMPEPALLTHPLFAEARNPEVVAALWLGYSLAKARVPRIAEPAERREA